MSSHLHVIDFDSRRRAQISRELRTRDLHTEIYEDAEEFLERLPNEGSVLILEAAARKGLEEFLTQVKGRGQFFPVTAYCNEPTPERIVQALRNGAIDYLQWPFEPRLLDSTLQRLVEERARRIELERERAAARELVAKLANREREVLLSLVNGNSNKQIAQELGISPRTAEVYRKTMMRKVRARSVSDAVRLAIYAGLWEGLPA